MVSDPLLSVVIPVFNEKDSIVELVNRVQNVPIRKELIIVDDGSSDETDKIISERVCSIYPNVIFLRHLNNRGKGSAIRTGLKAVSGDAVIIQDADLEYNPQDYPAIIRPIFDGEASVVFGSRFLKVNKWLFLWHWFLNRFLKRHYEIRYLHHFLGIQLLNFLANILYFASITDEATCYKAFKREVFTKIQLKCQGFEFCPEVTAKVRKAGYKIEEVPISYHPRSHKEGKKLNWKHGFEAIWTLIKYRFVD